MTHRRLVPLVVLAALALSGTAYAANPYPPPNKGSGQVVPSRIKVGQCAVFSGDGFAPLTPIAIQDNSAPAGTTTSNTQGQFSKQLCYGSGSTRGRHVLTGTGTGASGSSLTVSAVLTVQGVSQSANNPGTHAGGASTFSGTTGGQAATDGTGPDGSLGAPVAVTPPQPAAGVTLGNRGLWQLAYFYGGLSLALVAALALLILVRRRRRDEDEPDAGSAVAFA